jgi:hypothetical protein
MAIAILCAASQQIWLACKHRSILGLTKDDMIVDINAE